MGNLAKKPVIWGISGLVIGAVLGIAGYALFHTHEEVSLNTALRQSDINPNDEYRFIDPLIGLQNQSTATPPEFRSLDETVQAFIQSEIKKGNLTSASVYFREIGRQGGITVNPTEQYNPASLLKVPTMMAYFKIAESNPAYLQQKLVYTGAKDENTQEHFRSKIQLTPGGTYTVSELIEHMIKYSDNNAATMLIEHLNATNHEDAFNDLFNDLGITKLNLSDDFITTQAYVLFFRVLYNATYLSRDMSEKAMELLTQTDFKDGIVAVLPDDIAAAHKFGEFTIKAENQTIVKQELHDCGYIYYPNQVYSLCIMTKGNSFDELKPVVEGISQRIYDFVKMQD